MYKVSPANVRFFCLHLAEHFVYTQFLKQKRLKLKNVYVQWKVRAGARLGSTVWVPQDAPAGWRFDPQVLGTSYRYHDRGRTATIFRIFGAYGGIFSNLR